MLTAPGERGKEGNILTLVTEDRHRAPLEKGEEALPKGYGEYLKAFTEGIKEDRSLIGRLE